MCKGEIASKVCVISLLADEKLNQDILNRADTYLSELGYHNPQSRYFFSSQLKDLRPCLEGEFEEVILIAHTRTALEGHSILFKRNHTENNYRVLDGEIFRRALRIKKLRQLTLALCSAESVLRAYPEFQRLSKKYGIHLKLQPISWTASIGRGVRDQREDELTSWLIAEASQDENNASISCLLPVETSGFSKRGASSCVRHHYEIDIQAPLSFGFSTSVSFMPVNFHGDEKEGGWSLNPFSLELGFIKGLKLSLSLDPAQTTWEAFGFNISLIDIINIRRVD